MKLEIDNLKKHFGGIKAVDGLSVMWEGVGVRGLIGPNGAGKTVTFNLITGVYPPDDGKVILNDSDITGTPLRKMLGKGVGRTFQQPRPFESLTVMDNMKAGYPNNPGENPVYSLFELPRIKRVEKKAEEKALGLLKRIGLEEKKDVRTSELNIGDRKILEIGRTMMADPDLLLLDEPTAGVPKGETDKVLSFINEIKEDKLVIIVEHKMEVIMKVSEKIKVMHKGKLLAEGAPKEIQRNKEVREVYLGGEVTES